MVDVLEVFCGITVASTTSSIPQKLADIFGYFDFDGSGTVTYDELFILIFSTLRSMQKVLGRGHEPEDSDCERIVDEICLKAGKEPPAALISLADIEVSEERAEMSTECTNIELVQLWIINPPVYALK